MFHPKKMVFLGDSLTEAGTSHSGYISLLGERLHKMGRAHQVQLIGKGVGGNRVDDLLRRLVPDVLALSPDFVLVFIGTNDVWRQLDQKKRSLEVFQRDYEALLQKLWHRGIGFALCTPAVIGEKKDKANALDALLDDCARRIQALGQQFDCPVVDLRSIFTTFLQKNNHNNMENGLLTTDGVHLNDQGNELVAAALQAQLFG